MFFAALCFVVTLVAAQQDPSFVPANQQPPQINVPADSSQVGGQINIQPASGALPPFDPNNPQGNQQPPNSGLNQGQIPSSLFNQQGAGQVNPAQPPQPPLPPLDPNQGQQPGSAPFGNQPNVQNPQNPQFPPASSSEHGQQPQPSSSENGQPAFGGQAGSSTQDLFGTQPPSPESSSTSSTIIHPSANQNEPEPSHEQPNQATEGITGQPAANSSANAIVSGLVLLFAAFIGML